MEIQVVVDWMVDSSRDTYTVNCNNSIHKGRRFSGPAPLCFYAIMKKYREKFCGFRNNVYICTVDSQES